MKDLFYDMLHNGLKWLGKLFLIFLVCVGITLALFLIFKAAMLTVHVLVSMGVSVDAATIFSLLCWTLFIVLTPLVFLIR